MREPIPFYFEYMKKQTTQSQEICHVYHEVEFLYIHRGEGHISVGKNYYRLSEGVLIVIPPYEQHQFDIDSSDTAYIRSVLKIKPDLINLTCSLILT